MQANLNKSNAHFSGVRTDLAIGLFLTLLGTYAYFWQSRDWNAASRLMLTYSLVERQQMFIDGLERQCGVREFNPVTRRTDMVDGDLARFGSHFYTDKAPGMSLLGAIVYVIAKPVGGLPDHPIDESAIPYWPADYFITLVTSGVLTALLAVVVYAFSLRLGATHAAGVVLGLAYGLGTPALVYATLFYGHQASACCTFTSFFLLYRAAHEGRSNVWNMLLAGLLAGFSVVVEYQTAVISAVLGLYVIVAIRRVRLVLVFGGAGVLASALLAAYNYRAFGDPLDLGYTHEVSRQFSAIHSSSNPLGLRLPRWEEAREVLSGILWGPFRGLSFYAPVLLAAPLGLVALLARRFWGVALVAVAAVGWMLFLNVSYPLWQGGWCTGPRLIVPAIPFATLLVGGLLGVRRSAFFTALVGLAALAGGVLMLGCVAVGGRFPLDYFDPAAPRGEGKIDNPVLQIVLPHWSGGAYPATKVPQEELPGGRFPDSLCSLCHRHPASFLAGGRQFEWNVGRWLIERYLPAGLIPAEPSPWQALQFAPLGAYLVLMVGTLVVRCRKEVPTNRDKQRIAPIQSADVHS